MPALAPCQPPSVTRDVYGACTSVRAYVVRARACVRLCVHVFVHVCVCACVCVHVCVCVCVRARARVRACMRAWVRACARARARTHCLYLCVRARTRERACLEDAEGLVQVAGALAGAQERPVRDLCVFDRYVTCACLTGT